MHDLVFTKEILRALKDKLKTLPMGSQIIAVNAALSPLSHVKPETLAETFRAMVQGTEFEKTVLNIKTLKLGIKCRACNTSFSVDKPTTRCIECDDPDLDILYNKEFVIESTQSA